jgi:sugar phosphate isomerase/epimerase
MVYLTGFADEAASDIDGQILATRALGWKYIEARNINGVNIHDLSEVEFEHVAAKLEEAGIQVNCFGSAIANWATDIRQPFNQDLERVRRAIPRMQRLGTQLVRIMSYPPLFDSGGGVASDQMEHERFRRLRQICQYFWEAGLTPVHENCMNYGGLSWQHSLRLIENIPGLKLVFDTGNPVFSDDLAKPEPHPKQSSWEFYTRVREHIAYVHIKDGVWNVALQKITYTYPGEGDGDVRRIVEDLIHSGYRGGISIEPHLDTVPHANDVPSSQDQRKQNYIRYGRMMEKMILELVPIQASSA